MADEAHPIEENENSSTTPNPLQGLADDLEDVAAIRKYCLKNKALLSWLSPQKVGVVSNKSLKMNAPVLEIVLRKWCPVAPDRKTVPVNFLKKTGRVQQSLQQLCNVQKLSFWGIFCNDL
jgi:hypothetical protein